MAGAPIEALERIPLFTGLNKRELKQIARLFKERRFAAGETVVQEGSGGAAFFVIDSGQAAVSIKGRSPQILGPGDYFGEIALIDEGPRMATITASTELVCFGLTHWDFGPLVEANGTIGWKLLQAMAKMLRAERQEWKEGPPGRAFLRVCLAVSPPEADASPAIRLAFPRRELRPSRLRRRGRRR